MQSWKAIDVLQVFSQFGLAAQSCIASHVLNWSKQFIRQPIRILLRLRYRWRARFTVLIPFHQMHVNSQWHIAKQGVEKFTRRRGIFTIEHSPDRRSQSVQGALPDDPVIAEEM